MYIEKISLLLNRLLSTYNFLMRDSDTLQNKKFFFFSWSHLDIMKSYLGVVGEKQMFLGSGCDFSSELRDRIISCYLK